MQNAFWAGLMAAGYCLVAGAAVCGTTLMPEKPVTIEYNPKQGFPDHNGNFSAMLIAIPQSQLAEFDKTDGGNRQISRVNRAEAGAQLAFKLVFSGLAADHDGNGRVTYDLTVLAPDGQVYAASDYKRLAAVSGPVGDGKRVFDNRTKVVLMSFEPQDKPGIYTIKAVARDEVAGLEVPLTTGVEFVAPEKPAVEPAKVNKAHRKRSRRGRARA